MKHLLKRSFRAQVLVSVAIITLLPILLCNGLMLRSMVRRANDAQQREASSQLLLCRSKLQGLHEQIQDLSQSLAHNTVVLSALRNHNLNSRTLVQLLSRDGEELRDYARVDILLRDGTCGYSTGASPESYSLSPDWGILRAAAQSEALVTMPGNPDCTYREGLAIRDHAGKILGYAVFTVTRTHLNSLLSGCYGPANNLLFFNNTWRLLYSSNPTTGPHTALAIRQQRLDGEALTGDAQGTCRFYTLPFGEFQLVLQQPLIFSPSTLGIYNSIGLTLGLLSLILCMIYAVWMSNHLTQPISALSRAMGRVEQGELDVKLDLHREDEVGILGDAFNRMTREYRENLESTLRRQKELDETKVRMMQAQLNPHFLYNTLDSMKWLGVTNHVPKVAELATDLAALLRASISSPEFITVEQELDLIERYLEIQYIRFEDKFTCEIEVDERFMHDILPKLSLQPLVENAIIHGVADLNEGYIKITAREENGTLILTVEDNGRGIDPEMLEKLNHPGDAYPQKHLGLYNVSRMLRLHYGEAYGLVAASTPGQGSAVELHLPRIPMDSERRTLC